MSGTPRILLFFCLSAFADCLAQMPLALPRLEIQSRVEVSPPGGGFYNWYEAAADPRDPNNLIVCGSKGVAKENARYGFVFATSDGGRTWRTVLEDRNSAWVSEQSCAFGASGRVYFVSEASKMIDGAPHHEQGTTRIFVSDDTGRSWKEAAKTKWADYSFSVVDTDSGENQNRLYVFFNDVRPRTAEPGHSATDSDAETSRAGFMTFQDGDQEIKGPIESSNMGLLGNQGSFPPTAFLLRDGSLLSLYIGEKGFLGAVRTSRNRTELSDPVLIARRRFLRAEEPCLDEAAAYDRRLDRIYIAYNASRGMQCRFFLTTSVDGGKTWSKEQEVSAPTTMSHRFYSPAMAVNPRGILGLMWRDTPVSDCWYFAVSPDHGKAFTHPQPLSQCSNRRDMLLTESSASLIMQGFVWANSDPVNGKPSEGHAVPGVHVVDSRNVAERNDGSLTVTSDGVFHPVWIENGSGEGQMRTAAVSIAGTRREQLSPLRVDASETRDISQRVVVLYGGEQHYDISTGTLTETITLKNESTESIRSPVLIKAVSLNSEIGNIKIMNSTNGVSGPGAIWDLSRTMSGGVLEPGAVTEPYFIVFRVPNDAAPRISIDLITMRLQILSSLASRSAP
jgi:hypothetical protein